MLYKGEHVRLLRDLPEHGVKKHIEGHVVDVLRNNENQPSTAEVCFYTGSQSITAVVPLETVELAISSGNSGCTAVFWGLEENSRLIESGVHRMLDHGFEMRQGLNVMQLNYDPSERFWRDGDRLDDATGAQAAVASSTWDGCIVAFSGRQRFELEFRLRGRRPPYVMLHQRWETYEEQRLTTPPAMTLLRILLNLYETLRAEYCAVPVASNWLIDEEWRSLLQQPYFPDLFVIPQPQVPSPLPPLYRAQRLVNGRAIMTTLPVKFSPTDGPIERTQRELRLNALRACTAIGEKAYDQMYEAHGSATGLYSDAKEAFYDAISIANELGLRDEAERLSKRLEHIKAVFRSQFS